LSAAPPVFFLAVPVAVSARPLSFIRLFEVRPPQASLQSTLRPVGSRTHETSFPGLSSRYPCRNWKNGGGGCRRLGQATTVGAGATTPRKQRRHCARPASPSTKAGAEVAATGTTAVDEQRKR
jgi:hypothetical protein